MTTSTGNDREKTPSLKEHDAVFHPEGFDPEHSTCKFREKMAKLDSVDKLYAVSDIHMSGIDGVDDTAHGTIMIAGDFMEKAKHESDFKSAGEWFEKKFKPWCEKHKDQKIVLIGGNTDKWLYYNRDKIEWPKNVTYLDDSEAEVNGMKVYGTSWTPKNLNGAWEVGPEELEKQYSKIPEGLDVLITHAPPRIEGSDIDYDTTFHKHFGSPELTKAILEKKPKLVLCGHVHSGSHKPVKIGDSIVMNVARVDDDRYEKSWHGKSIGLDKTADKLGFLVDMDEEGKISLGKMSDIPAGIRDLKRKLLDAAVSINGHIDDGDYRPNEKKIAEAEKAIEEVSGQLKNFNHPKRKMLEGAIEQFKKSRLSGWKERMSRIGKLFDTDYYTPSKPTRVSPSSYGNVKVWSGHGDGYGEWGGGSHYGGGYYGKTKPYYYGGHSSHYGESDSDKGRKFGMSTTDILLAWKKKKEALLGIHDSPYHHSAKASSVDNLPKDKKGGDDAAKPAKKVGLMRLLTRKRIA